MTKRPWRPRATRMALPDPQGRGEKPIVLATHDYMRRFRQAQTARTAPVVTLAAETAFNQFRTVK